ncbi:MAG: hypothetical protein KDD78_07905 [Caldilineaceae bacterium]|nr:hypothetical protein [Caldilineaceae bacterium]
MSSLSTTTTSSSSAVDEQFQVFGRGALCDYFGDRIVYRNLEPLDAQLPKLKTALRHLGLSTDILPRKQDVEYAKVALWFATEAQSLRGIKTEPAELLFIGDTLYNDGGAYRNMIQASGWKGSCFIGYEQPEDDAAICIDDDNIYSTNRWSKLGEWVQWLRTEQGFQLDENTVVIVDIDKTALGARGRNDKIIDQSRIMGASRTMSNLLGARFDSSEFQQFYTELNQPRYHGLTEDNQDYIAYICLVLSTGLIPFDDVVDQVAKGALENFDQFTRLVETRMMISPSNSEVLRQSHDAVITSVRNGDPTPFKRFRRQEFISTVEHMGNMADDAPVEEMLTNEITLTEEVCELAEWLNQRGSLLLCLSDKPDEASMPHKYVSPDLAPVHRAVTHRVGTSIKAVLEAIE